MNINANPTIHVDMDALEAACERYSNQELGHSALCLFSRMAHKYEKLGCPRKGLDITLAEMCIMIRVSTETSKSAQKARDQLIDCGLIKYKKGYKEDTENGKKGNVKFRHLRKEGIQQATDSQITAPGQTGTPGNSSTPSPAAAIQYADRTAGNKFGINL